MIQFSGISGFVGFFEWQESAGINPVPGREKRN